MPKGWKFKRIGELGRVVTGKTPSTKLQENFNGAYPFITIPDLDGRMHITSTARTLSELGADSIHGAKLPAGSVMISCIATVGKCGITSVPSFTNQQINSVIPNKDVIDTRFLYYVFKRLGKELERAGGGGSVYTNVSKSRFANIEVHIPSNLDEQRAIAHILATLDDKIELNRRMSETLDDMARAQFNDTFLGTAFSSSAETQLVPVQHFFQILSGGTPKTSEPENWGGSIPWFSVADTPPDSSTFVINTAKTITEHGIETSPAQVVPAWTTIISARGTVGKLAMAGVPLAFNQSCYGLRAANGAGPSFVYLLAGHLVEQLKALSHGSVFSTITRRTFDAVRFPCPSRESLTTFEAKVAPLYSRILVATQESITLAELRDTLLPKLISGELRIPEAEQLVSEVV